jgi:hypothetical protein
MFSTVLTRPRHATGTCHACAREGTIRDHLIPCDQCQRAAHAHCWNSDILPGSFPWKLGFVCSTCILLGMRSLRRDERITPATASAALASAVSASVAASSRCFSQGTWRVYGFHVARAQQLERDMDARLLPLTAATAHALFGAMQRRGASWSEFRGVRSACRAWHGTAGLPDPFLPSAMHRLWKGHKRTAPKARTPKVGFTLAQLMTLLQFCSTSLQPRLGRRDCAFIVLMFFGIQRCSECLLRADGTMGLRRRHVRFHHTLRRVSYFVQRMKNDAFAKGRWKFLPTRTASGVAIFDTLWAYATVLDADRDLTPESNEPFFQTTSPGGGSYSGRPVSSYAGRIRGLCARAFNMAHEQTAVFGTHSLRRGGCIHAERCGVPLELLMRFVGWRSIDALREYTGLTELDMVGMVSLA